MESIIDKTTFNLTITEACNLACKYCYMANRQNYMTAEIIDNIYNNTDQMIKMFNGNKFGVDFFGGEPLLNWDIIEYTVNKFSNSPKLSGFCIVSNLLLLDQNKIDFIKKNNIGCSWSFDGLWNADVRIKNDTMSSSFDEYINKLDLIKQVVSGCKCMVTPEHMKTNISMADNLTFMIDKLGIMPDFTVSRDSDWTDDILDIFEKQLDNYARVYVDYCKRGKLIASGFFNLFLMDTILAKKTCKRNFSCFAGQNGFTVMPNGDIFPCSRYGSNDLCKLGNITDINNVKVFEYKDKLNPIYFDKCVNCEMHTWCNSGCQFNQQCNNFTPLECYCKLYKIIYHKALDVYSLLRDNTDWLKSLHYKNY